jgi:hypothetical protein
MTQAATGQVERVLDDLIARLSKTQSTAEVRAALIEAKRLRNVTTRWAAIPPPPDARREMLTRVMELIAQVSASLSKPPPPLEQNLATPLLAEKLRSVLADAPEEPPRSPLPPKSAPRSGRGGDAAFRPTEWAIDSVRGSRPPAARPAPDSEGPPTMTPREVKHRGLTPPPIPAVVARGLTPSPRSKPPVLDRSTSPRPAEDAFPPLTPRSRTGESNPPPPSSPRQQPLPLRGRKPSDMTAPPSPSPAALFGAPSRNRTKTGIAEAEENARQVRSALPTAPPPPMPSAPTPAGRSPAPAGARKETRLMGSQGVTDALHGLRPGGASDTPPPRTRPSNPAPEAAETLPPRSPHGVSISSAPSPAPVNAISVPREGKLEGFSSSISMPGMRPIRSSPPAGTKKPSHPTMKLPTPVPAPLRSAPPSSSDKPLRTVVAPGVTIVRPESAQWQPHPTVGGVTLKLLYRDPRSGVYTALLRLAPGAVFPRRRHAASEEVLLISGLATIGTFELRAGEYCRAESESVHDPITTSTGCTLFVCGSEHDEFLDEP